jgi:hypothetical protein
MPNSMAARLDDLSQGLWEEITRLLNNLTARMNDITYPISDMIQGVLEADQAVKFIRNEVNRQVEERIMQQ